MLRVMLLSGALSVAIAAPAGAVGRVLSRNGRVGPFSVERSTTAAVRAVQGRPNHVDRSPGEGGQPVLEWRYGCGHGRFASYFFDTRGVLANFVTSCHSWRTADGTRVGMSRREAEGREGKEAAEAGCGSGLSIDRSGRAALFVTFTSESSPVRFLAVAGRNGVLGC